MNSSLFPRLALTNIKKNKQLYLPYIISSVITIGMFYIIAALSSSEDIASSKGGDAITMALQFGIYVIAIFSGIFLLYTNSFLMKQRTKELGLYNVLGMEKRHICGIVFFESFFSFLLSLAGGIAFGVCFEKLTMLLLLKLMNFDVILGFNISVTAIIATSICFGLIFAAGFFFNCIKIAKAKPIDLLHSGNVGEKEPKTKAVSAILGVILMAAGYTIAIVTKKMEFLIFAYFVAVICVILGTYLLFLSGSIALLKLLKKNKHFYYNKNHFISVSGMLYRMKQNAVGLANICILSTMVLVTISGTAALYAGSEYAIDKSNPSDFRISVQIKSDYSETDTKQIDNEINKYLKDGNIPVKNLSTHDFITLDGYINNNQIVFDAISTDVGMYKSFYCITAEGYKSTTGHNAVLKNNEVLVYTDSDMLGDSFELFGKEYKVMQKLDDLGNFPMYFGNSIYDSCVIIFSDMQELLYVRENYEKIRFDEDAHMRIYHQIMFNTGGSDDQQDKYYSQIEKQLEPVSEKHGDYANLQITSRLEKKSDYYSVYGSLFFLGIILGSLFLLVAIMIIYYKQTSEGYADRNRFEIMQKVGMSRAEVKKSIRSQVLTVFFLPLVTAFIHLTFSYPLTSRCLLMIQQTNTLYFIISIIITAVIFAVFYLIVYAITAKTYYKIVSR